MSTFYMLEKTKEASDQKDPLANHFCGGSETELQRLFLQRKITVGISANRQITKPAFEKTGLPG
jgi:hypothetical protein